MGAFKMAQPVIPRGLLHTMYDLKAGSKFDQAKGGQWVPGGATERAPFQGAVLPVSDKDLVRKSPAPSLTTARRFTPMAMC